MSGKQHWVSGSKCWAPDEERAFVEAIVVEHAGKKVKVQLTQDQKEVEFQERQLLPRSPNARCVADMDELQELHVASVLQNVEILFGQNAARSPGKGVVPIYSSVGPVLIAMNPFVYLPIYEQDWVEAYSQASGNALKNKILGPHCFKTVEESYSNLKNVKNQAVVICGESGAGKTVTNRKMMDYLCEVAKPKTKEEQAEIGVDPQAISDANVLLEAFGNAKTTRNDNSSRFGKYTKLSFLSESNYTLAGCSVDHYLLERSRVVAPNPLERNYHIFYQILAACSSGSSKTGVDYKFAGLTKEDFRYTKGTAAVKSVDDGEDFGLTWKQLAQAGFPDDMRGHIMKTVAGVLHLGNVLFVGGADGCQVDPKTKQSFDCACELLEIDAAKLAKAMVHQVIYPPNSEPIWKELGVSEAESQRDTVAKSLYSRMFDKIVLVIGQRLNKKSAVGQNKQAPQAEIGLLDIFGFEDMPINDFEQLFINLTNERIQHLFNSIMFERELEAYKKEGIASAFDAGTDNLETVRLFTSPSNPPGIIKLLTESCLMRSSRDGEKFVSVLNTSFGKHPSFKVCGPQDATKMARKKGLKSSGGGRGAALDYRENFMVKHYAGEIMYTVNKWVPKNNDTLYLHISEVLANSECQFVSDMFESEESGKSTVGEKFAQQLEVLASALEKGETLFVRCIKTNPQMVPGLVDRKMVLEQLVNGGVIAALEMRHRGLPDRMEYDMFCMEFNGIADKKDHKKEYKVQARKLCLEVFGEAKEDSAFAFGHTKVFMKSYISSFLRAAAALRNRNIVKKVQRNWRVFMGTEKVNHVVRSWAAFQEAENLAKSYNLQDLPMAADALKEAKSQIGPMQELLEKLKQQHGTDVQKIAKGLPSEKTRTLYGIAEKTMASVEKAVELKDQAEQILGQRITRCMRSVADLLEKVQKMQEDCDAMSDVVEKEEMDTFKAAYKAAESRLVALQDKELSDIRKAGVGTSFLDADGNISVTESDVSPKVNEMLAQAQQLVDKVAELASGIARLRVNFTEEAADAIALHEETNLKMDALTGQTTRFVAEGMDDVVEKVSEALLYRTEVSDLLEASRDVEKYRSVVEAYSQATKAAIDMFETQMAELRKREAEKSARMEIQEGLNQLDARVRTCSKDTAQMVKQIGDERCIEAEKVLTDYIQEVAASGYSSEELDKWQAQVDALTAKVTKKIADTYKMMNEAKVERKENFQRKFSMFNQASQKGDEEEVQQYDPVIFIESEGATPHRQDLIDIHDALARLGDAGASRSAVTRCVNSFVKNIFGGAAPKGGGSGSKDMRRSETNTSSVNTSSVSNRGQSPARGAGGSRRGMA